LTDNVDVDIRIGARTAKRMQQPATFSARLISGWQIVVMPIKDVRVRALLDALNST
jgi:hypothetical protein